MGISFGTCVEQDNIGSGGSYEETSRQAIMEDVSVLVAADAACTSVRWINPSDLLGNTRILNLQLQHPLFDHHKQQSLHVTSTAVAAPVAASNKQKEEARC